VHAGIEVYRRMRAYDNDQSKIAGLANDARNATKRAIALANRKVFRPGAFNAALGEAAERIRELHTVRKLEFDLPPTMDYGITKQTVLWALGDLPPACDNCFEERRVGCSLCGSWPSDDPDTCDPSQHFACTPATADELDPTKLSDRDAQLRLLGFLCARLSKDYFPRRPGKVPDVPLRELARHLSAAYRRWFDRPPMRRNEHFQVFLRMVSDTFELAVSEEAWENQTKMVEEDHASGSLSDPSELLG
jgi:hypothetical protein